MKQTVVVKNVEFGAGRPKICLPLVAKDEDALRAQLTEVARCAPDLVEFRADWYEAIEDTTARRAALAQIRAVLLDTPLLFTFRTKQEGGERPISEEAYLALCLEVLAEDDIDLIDVEFFLGEAVVSSIVDAAHEKGVTVIVSSHDFAKTPSRQVLIDRFEAMEQTNADLLKLAVMPTCPEDVLTLLSVTAERNEKGTRPLISMSMGRLGAISRLCGQVFGSCVTFGAAGKSSAPGQLQAEELRMILDILQK